MLHIMFAKKRKCFLQDRFIEAANFYYKIKILKKNPNSLRAQTFLKDKWLDVCSDLNLSPNGPFDLKECIDPIAEYFGMNVYVIDGLKFDLYYKYPNLRNESNPSVFLLLSSDKQHVDLIMDRFKAFPNIGSICIFCNKVTKRYSRHRCYNKKICFLCNKYKLDLLEDSALMENGQQPFLTSRNKNFFCIKTETSKCKNCGLEYRSATCFKKHVAIGQCHLKMKCPSCQKVYLKKYDHFCDKKFCIRCKTNFNSAKSHFCRMAPQPRIDEDCILAVFDCETVQEKEKNFSSCYKCFYKEKDYLKHSGKTRSQLSDQEKTFLLCDDHKNCNLDSMSYHAINLITVFIESTRRGHFSRIEFSDSKLNLDEDMELIPDCKIIPKENYYLEQNHGEEIVRKKQNSRRKRAIGSSRNEFPILISKPEDERKIYVGEDFNQDDFEYIKGNFSAVEKFIIYFMRNQFRNTTFISTHILAFY